MMALFSGGKGLVLMLAGLFILAVVGGAWASYQHTLAQNRELAAANAQRQLEIDQAKATNAAAVAAIAEQQRLHAQDLAAIDAEHQAKTEAEQKLRTIEKDASDAPQSDDGPVAPLARRGLARLRQLAAPAGDPRAPDRHAGANPAGAAAGRPAAGAAGGR